MLFEATQEKRLKKKRKEKKKNKKKVKKDKKENKKAKRKREKVQGPRLPTSSSSSTSSSVSFNSVAQRFARAAEAGSMMMAQYLVRRYGFSWANARGEGALHLAARSNQPGLMAWLLSQPQAEPVLETRNSAGESPLLLATRLCRGCVAMRLVEALADPGACDAQGESAESLDLDGLLREAERDETCRHAAKEDQLLQAVAAARRKREEADWRRQLLEMIGQEDDDFCRFESHEDLESRDTGRPESWMDDIAAEAEARAANANSMSRILAAKAKAEKPTEAGIPDPGDSERPKKPPPSGEGEAKKGPRPDQKPSHQDPEMEAQARVAARAKDEARWKLLEEMTAEGAKVILQEAKIPWPSGPLENPLRIDPEGHPKVVRSQLRAGLLRWHPDKFQQKFGQFLPSLEKERSAILARVKALAQQLTRQMAELPDP
ncbi:unnamed protein product [Durusdinium trenchii]|uniref:NF-kappa-B inhibitor-like protein 1 n=1 Tax=Durusdinium trenchii TaxID=1381693 RepID=A0ABP0JEW8_9DINO